MKKLLTILSITILMVISACTMPSMKGIQSENEALIASKASNIIIYDNIIFYDGFKYGKLFKSKPDTLVEVYNYENNANQQVATFILKGVSQDFAYLELSNGNKIKINKTDVFVTNEDAILYLIQHGYLTKEVKKVKAYDENIKIDDNNVKLELNNNNLDIKKEKLILKEKEVKTDISVISNNIKGNIDLKYIFKVGDIYNYKSTDNTAISMSMSGLDGMGDLMGGVPDGLKQKIKTTTNFSLKITRVFKDGSASFIININSFKAILLASNQLMASDEGMKNLTAKGIITSKGKVTFLEDLYIINTKRGERLLVTGKATKNGVSTTSSNGDEEVTLQASYNPKTGELIASAKVRELQKKKVKIKVTKEDTKVDILPKKLMELFLLPEEKVAVGQKMTFKAPGLKSDFIITSKKKNLLNLNAIFTSDTQSMTQEDMGMNMDMHADVNYKFDIKKGRLISIDGDIKTKMKGQGMDLKVNSNINMKLSK